MFLDGRPSEYLEYLLSAESHLAPNAVVVADNAGLFGEKGLKPYLDYVRNSQSYESAFVESPLEWADNAADGMEISKFNATAGKNTMR